MSKCDFIAACQYAQRDGHTCNDNSEASVYCGKYDEFLNSRMQNDTRSPNLVCMARRQKS